MGLWVWVDLGIGRCEEWWGWVQALTDHASMSFGIICFM